MPQPSHLSPDPFFYEGGPESILLIHGFTGAPTEMRPWGEFLAQHGMTVAGIQLPGHGTTPEDLQRVRRDHWIAACEAASDELLARGGKVFVGGLSLGGLLALWLGAHHQDLAGLILLAPGLKVRDWRIHLAPLAKHVIHYVSVGQREGNDLSAADALNYVWCYDTRPVAAAAEVLHLQRTTRRLLPRVRQPVLIMQGRNDTALAPASAQIIYDRIGSVDKSLVWLEQSGHNVLIDSDRERVWEESYNWIRTRARQRIHGM